MDGEEGLLMGAWALQQQQLEDDRECRRPSATSSVGIEGYIHAAATAGAGTPDAVQLACPPRLAGTIHSAPGWQGLPVHSFSPLKPLQTVGCA